MLKVLIVEDDTNKLQKITVALLGVEGVKISDVTNVVDATSAKTHLMTTIFDLLILDIAIPIRIDEEVSRDGGIQLLDEIIRREQYKLPSHVVGITSFTDIHEVASTRFSRDSFTVIFYDPTSDEWVERLQAKVRHIIRSNQVRLSQPSDSEGLLEKESASSLNHASTDPSDNAYALIMKGGGVKGLAYIGALKELEKYYKFNWYVGTSAGAIAAAFLSAGYTTIELEEVLKNKNFKDFLDAPIYKIPINLIIHKGFYPARTFTKWIDNLIATKLNSPYRVRLNQLPNRVTIYASRRGQKALVFDSLDPKTKSTPVAHAVRCSMAIPLIFTPERDEGVKVFDGGMQNNYPVQQLLSEHPNTKFIGLYLGAEHYEGNEKDPSLMKELYSIWSEASDIEALEKYHQHTVIIDPRPISTRDFSLTDEEKEYLLAAGKASALKFLSKQLLPNKPAKETVNQAVIEAVSLRKSITGKRSKRFWRR